MPPRLLTTPDAPYPEAARAAGVEGEVGLRLTVDAEGRVTAAEVVEPAGNGFDEAAREASLRFRFEPATRDGRPMAARIRYAYAFRLPPPPEPPAAPVAPPGEAATSLPAPAPAPAPVRPKAAAGVPTEVTVQGLSAVEQRQRSAEAVTVRSLARERNQAADLGEVLARVQGVSVRRLGGLGSGARIGLAGLTDEQVRIYVDDVPIEIAGFTNGLANIPVHFVERLEIYRGVVPVRFGADALGGLLNIASDPAYRGPHASALYELGSFGTQRASLVARHRDPRTGFVTRAQVFRDRADNDYRMDVEVPDGLGRLRPARVRRFHDGYDAYGAHVDVGFVGVPWARRLVARAFLTGFDRELQHNAVATVPYGDVTYGGFSRGANLRYEQALGERVDVAALVAYMYDETRFRDVGLGVYDWYGDVVRERRQPGEIEAVPIDQVLRDHNLFGRLLVKWDVAPGHELHFGTTPRLLSRRGDDYERGPSEGRDPLTARRDVLSAATGVEYRASLAAGRFQNVAFVKHYLFALESEEPLAGGTFRQRDAGRQRFGAGDSLVAHLTPWLYAKGSYEYATRVPTPYEIFGNGVLVNPNLALSPEVAHNANAGLTVDAKRTRAGDVYFETNAFLRDVDRQIVLLGDAKSFQNQNVYRARSVGLEAVARWRPWGGRLALDANGTYQDFRNASGGGTFGAFKGDRIPNRPWLFANLGATVTFPRPFGAAGGLEIYTYSRYVHDYFRGWESQGLREFKQTIPSQFTHNVGATYALPGPFGTAQVTVEVQNVTDARAFDSFGLPRPGRAAYVKLAANF